MRGEEHMNTVINTWLKAKNKCEICGKELKYRRSELDKFIEKFSEEVPIYKWKEHCYKCGEETPRVSYNLIISYNNKIGDIASIDRLLEEKYEFVEKIWSNTRRENVYGNVCKHCGAYQGNFFIVEEMLLLEDEGIIDNYLDCNLKVEVSLSDIDIEYVNEELGYSDATFRYRIKGNGLLQLICSDCLKDITEYTD